MGINERRSEGIEEKAGREGGHDAHSMFIVHIRALSLSKNKTAATATTNIYFCAQLKY